MPEWLLAIIIACAIVAAFKAAIEDARACSRDGSNDER